MKHCNLDQQVSEGFLLHLTVKVSVLTIGSSLLSQASHLLRGLVPAVVPTLLWCFSVRSSSARVFLSAHNSALVILGPISHPIAFPLTENTLAGLMLSQPGLSHESAHGDGSFHLTQKLFSRTPAILTCQATWEFSVLTQPSFSAALMLQNLTCFFLSFLSPVWC